jgi:transcriptional regulator with XRE-family HTH domain/mannose-6-phosphate isomerase-like protein (cupin superfamily)
MAVPRQVATKKGEIAGLHVGSTDARESNSLDTPPATSTNRLAPGLVGTRLRARREAKGISLRQFARDLEVSASFISQLETGKAQPSVATLYSICAALDISTDELFAGDTAVEARGKTGELTDASNNSWRAVDGVASVSSRNGHHDTGGSSPMLHPHERTVLVLDSGVTWESLIATHHEQAEFMFVRYDVGGSSTLEGRLIRHVGTEYGFIMRGTLEIVVGFETYVLTAGDSISFDSSRPHRLTNIGDVPVEAIWVTLDFRGN